MCKIFGLVIFLLVTIEKVKCENEIYEFYPCIGVDKVLETFTPSDPFAYNITILISKYDLISDRFKISMKLKFDSLSNYSYNFDPLYFFSDGYSYEGDVISENRTDLIFRISPYIGYKKIPNLISLKLNNQEICKDGVHKDMWINFVELMTTTTTTTSTTTAKPLITPDTIFGECGKRPDQFSPFIVRGYNSKPGDWPWHSAIYRLNTHSSQLTYTCGGTLVSKTRVITAGHCVIEFGSLIVPERVYVSLGKYNFIGNDHGVQEKQVFEIILHPQYFRNNLTNDIAILKLSSEVTFTDYVRPICLKDVEYSNKSEIFNQMGFVVGWGRDENGNHSSQLTEAQLPIKSDADCYKRDSSFFGIFLHDGNFCVGYDNGTNVCNGDSGGGLFMPLNTTNGKQLWFLRGIVSLGAAIHDQKICNPNHYSLFTDVAHYMNFIKPHM